MQTILLICANFHCGGQVLSSLNVSSMENFLLLMKVIAGGTDQILPPEPGHLWSRRAVRRIFHRLWNRIEWEFGPALCCGWYEREPGELRRFLDVAAPFPLAAGPACVGGSALSPVLAKFEYPSRVCPMRGGPYPWITWRTHDLCPCSCCSFFS